MVSDHLEHLDNDPMPAELPARILTAVRDLEHRIGQVRAITCTTKGCHRDAVVFPPAACAEHGGLEAVVRP